MAAPVYILTNVVQDSSFSSASPALLTFCLFDDSHGNHGEMISTCGLISILSIFSHTVEQGRGKQNHLGPVF